MQDWIKRQEGPESFIVREGFAMDLEGLVAGVVLAISSASALCYVNASAASRRADLPLSMCRSRTGGRGARCGPISG